MHWRTAKYSLHIWSAISCRSSRWSADTWFNACMRHSHAITASSSMRQSPLDFSNPWPWAAFLFLSIKRVLLVFFDYFLRLFSILQQYIGFMRRPAAAKWTLLWPVTCRNWTILSLANTMNYDKKKRKWISNLSSVSTEILSFALLFVHNFIILRNNF